MRTTPLRAGDAAPDFTLPAVNQSGDVSLADYRNKSAVLLGLYRGLHCPFCRRQIAQLSRVRESLAGLGVVTVAIVNTPRERARLYFRYHPTELVLVSDPEARTHRAFGVPCVVLDEAFAAARVNPTGELARPMQPMEANTALNAKDGFELTTADEAIVAAHGTQLGGHFLIDASGTVRWMHIEAERGYNDIGRFPGPEEIVAATAQVLRG